MDKKGSRPDGSADREERIIDAVLVLLSRQGISGVSMRAVAQQAGVGLGLVNYYFDDKVSLIASALRRIEEQDLRFSSPIRPRVPRRIFDGPFAGSPNRNSSQPSTCR